MKILIDMNLSPAWVSVLEDAGHTASHWSAIGSMNAPDREILSWAKMNGYVLFTHDLDFGAILAATAAGVDAGAGAGAGTGAPCAVAVAAGVDAMATRINETDFTASSAAMANRRAASRSGGKSVSASRMKRKFSPQTKAMATARAICSGFKTDTGRRGGSLAAPWPRPEGAQSYRRSVARCRS